MRRAGCPPQWARLAGVVIAALAFSACGGGGRRYEVVETVEQTDALGAAMTCWHIRDVKHADRRYETCQDPHTGDRFCAVWDEAAQDCRPYESLPGERECHDMIELVDPGYDY